MPDSRRTTVFRARSASDAPVVHRMDRDAARSDPAMNAIAVLYVNEHLQELLDEAAERHALKPQRPSLRQRIASAASKAQASLGMPLDDRGTILPKLQDYPYRGGDLLFSASSDLPPNETPGSCAGGFVMSRARRPSAAPAHARPARPARHSPCAAPARHSPSAAPARHSPSAAPARHSPSGSTDERPTSPDRRVDRSTPEAAAALPRAADRPARRLNARLAGIASLVDPPSG